MVDNYYTEPSIHDIELAVQEELRQIADGSGMPDYLRFYLGNISRDVFAHSLSKDIKNIDDSLRSLATHSFILGRLAERNSWPAWQPHRKEL